MVPTEFSSAKPCTLCERLVSFLNEILFTWVFCIVLTVQGRGSFLSEPEEGSSENYLASMDPCEKFSYSLGRSSWNRLNFPCLPRIGFTLAELSL